LNLTHTMLNPMRFGPVDASGLAKKYPAWWIAALPKDSAAFEQLLRVRALYPRIKAVMGRQWIDEIMESSDYRFFHEEMDAFISRWEDEDDQAYLKTSDHELDFEMAYDHMKSMLDEFDPLWVDNRPYGDFDDEDEPTIVNERPLEMRVLDKLEVESLTRDLEALKVSIWGRVPPPAPQDMAVLLRNMAAIRDSIDQAIAGVHKRGRSDDP
jgi:hypothetical protein